MEQSTRLGHDHVGYNSYLSEVTRTLSNTFTGFYIKPKKVWSVPSLKVIEELSLKIHVARIKISSSNFNITCVIHLCAVLKSDTEGLFQSFEIYLQISIYFPFLVTGWSITNPEKCMTVHLFVILVTYYNISIPDTLINSHSGFQQSNLCIHTASWETGRLVLVKGIKACK